MRGQSERFMVVGSESTRHKTLENAERREAKLQRDGTLELVTIKVFWDGRWRNPTASVLREMKSAGIKLGDYIGDYAEPECGGANFETCLDCNHEDDGKA